MKAIFTLLICLLLFSSCNSYEHDGIIVKDADGNMYHMRANSITNNTYYITKIDTTKLQNLLD